MSFQTDWWWSDQISVWSKQKSHWIITINGKMNVWKCKLIFPTDTLQQKIEITDFKPFFSWWKYWCSNNFGHHCTSSLSCRCSVCADRGSFGQNCSRGGQQRAFCGLCTSLQRCRQKRPKGVCARTQIRPVTGAQSGEQLLVCLHNGWWFPYPRINAIHNIIITQLIILNPAELELG